MERIMMVTEDDKDEDDNNEDGEDEVADEKI